MECAMATTQVQNPRVVQRRLGLYRVLCCVLTVIMLSAIMLLGVRVAAPSPAPPPETIRATRLEIVNEAGQVVWRAEARQSGGTMQLWSTAGKLSVAVHATPLGGYLEIFNGAETALFTVGKTPTQKLPGPWERQQHAVEQQHRELDRQRQELSQLLRRLDALEHLDRTATVLERQGRGGEDLRRDLEQQRRELDQQRRQLDAVERQLRSLERR
jgi:hypothetical protein